MSGSLVMQSWPWAISRIHFFLQANSHTILGVFPKQRLKRHLPLQLWSYRELRAIDRGNDRFVSPFDRRGIIALSRRLERFLFWPMGIASPGAMRIRGTHAIAFVGRRHFDDPLLLQKLGLGTK